MKYLLAFAFLLASQFIAAQDTTRVIHADSTQLRKDSAIDDRLRIINMNPFFTLHVDSILQYTFEINNPADR